MQVINRNNCTWQKSRSKSVSGLSSIKLKNWRLLFTFLILRKFSRCENVNKGLILCRRYRFSPSIPPPVDSNVPAYITPRYSLWLQLSGSRLGVCRIHRHPIFKHSNNKKPKKNWKKFKNKNNKKSKNFYPSLPPRRLAFNSLLRSLRVIHCPKFDSLSPYCQTT